MHLKIITSDKIVFDEDVDAIYTKGMDGEFGVLPNHVPLMSALDIGVTKVIRGGNTKYFTTMGGVFQFKDNEGLILTATAEDGNNIDVARAKAAMERAKALLDEHDAAIDAKRAEAAIARAKARLKASLAE